MFIDVGRAVVRQLRCRQRAGAAAQRTLDAGRSPEEKWESSGRGGANRSLEQMQANMQKVNDNYPREQRQAAGRQAAATRKRKQQAAYGTRAYS
jgi:hypothetical protein